jgi:hypothetical protein
MRPGIGSMLRRACRLCLGAVSHEMDEAKKEYIRTLEERTEVEYVETSPLLYVRLDFFDH